MLRAWTTGPHGGDYLVVAGAARDLDSPLTDSPGARTRGRLHDPASVFRGRLGGALRWRGRGMVVVQRRDWRWSWETRSKREAYTLAADLTGRIQTGQWVPETMEQPAPRDAVPLPFHTVGAETT